MMGEFAGTRGLAGTVSTLRGWNAGANSIILAGMVPADTRVPAGSDSDLIRSGHPLDEPIGADVKPAAKMALAF